MYTTVAASAYCQLIRIRSAGWYNIKTLPSLAAYTSLDFTGILVLIAGEQILARFGSLGASAGIDLMVHGYRLKLY
jgi:hypothetical protein